MDPPPFPTLCLPCCTTARHPDPLPCGPCLTITPEGPTPLAQNPPAEKARCSIAPTAASKDFSRDPQGRVSILGCTGSPQPRCPPGQGRSPHPAGISRLSGAPGTAAPTTLTCTTLSISHPSSPQLIGKRRRRPWRGSRRETAPELSNRAVTLQLQIAFLQETNPSR